jgi:hypothetical protein
MITMFDMETGKIIQCSALPIAPNGMVSATTHGDTLQPRLALQEIPINAPKQRLAATLACFDIAEILAKYR